MKAAVCYEFGKPLVIEDGTLSGPEDRDVKVPLAATAVCHSDIHDWKGELPGGLPFVGGHESAGYVEKTGAGGTSVKAGEPRVHNKKGQSLELKGNIGGFAEYAVVDESQVVKVPKDMPLEQAALLACGVITGFGGVVNRAKVRPFQSVVVMGGGGVGLNAVQGAAYVGAYPIIAVDVLDSRLKMAMDFGATHAVNGKREDAADAIKKLTGGRGAEFVFVAVGRVAAMQQGLPFNGVGGTLVRVG